MASASIHFDRVRNLALSAVKDLKIVKDHEDIVNAIEAKDAELAKSIMRRHLSRFEVAAASIREKYPQYIK